MKVVRDRGVQRFGFNQFMIRKSLTVFIEIQSGFGLPKGSKLHILLAGLERIIVHTMELWRHIASLCVEHKGHIGGMQGGLTKVDPDAGPVTPFIVGLPALE